MSPHGLVVFTAILLGAGGKLLFPQFTLRIVVVSAMALPAFAALYFRELPSLLGLAIITPITIVGAVLGAIAGTFLNRLWYRFHGSS